MSFVPNSAPPPYAVQPGSRTNETEPLLPRRDDQNDRCCRGKGRFELRWITLGFFFVILVAGVILGPIITIKTAKLDSCPEAEEMERNRGKWAVEERVHDAAVEGREEVYQLWRVEDATHTAKLRYWGKEDLERDEIQKEWNRGAVEHERAEREREEVQREWKREVLKHERSEREHQSERLRMHLFWENLSTERCVRYKRRQYRARLMNVRPSYEHPIEACMKTPMPINGADKFPLRCEDKGIDGLYGIWEEDGEGYCATFFEQFQPMECTAWGSGLKRYRMYMAGLNPGDSWRDMCSSTPAQFLNRYFDGPTYCDEQDGRVYGYWEVPDDYCVPY